MTAFGSWTADHVLTGTDVGAGGGWAIKGNWAAATAYVANDVVSCGGELWLSTASQTGVHPWTSANWTLIGNAPDNTTRFGCRVLPGADVPRNEGVGYTANVDGTNAFITATSAKPAFIESASSAGANAAASCYMTGMAFFRGATTDYNAGFLARGMVYYPDSGYDQSGASTGSRAWGLLMSSSWVAAMFAADRGGNAYHFAGFNRCSVNGGATDTNWQFVTGNGSTQTVADTGIAWAIQKVMDFQIACPAGSTAIYWRIRNLTDGTSASGNATGTLPGTTTGLGVGTYLRTINALTRKVHLGYFTCTADRC